jgi:hypothetical protein
VWLFAICYLELRTHSSAILYTLYSSCFLASGVWRLALALSLFLSWPNSNWPRGLELELQTAAQRPTWLFCFLAICGFGFGFAASAIQPLQPRTAAPRGAASLIDY